VILISSTRLIKKNYDRDSHTNILMHMKSDTKICEISMHCNVLLLKFNSIENKHANLRLGMGRFGSVPVRVLPGRVLAGLEPTECRFGSVRFRVFSVPTQKTKDTKALEIVLKMRS
jgi:hypothetical protein